MANDTVRLNDLCQLLLLDSDKLHVYLAIFYCMIILMQFRRKSILMLLLFFYTHFKGILISCPIYLTVFLKKLILIPYKFIMLNTKCVVSLIVLLLIGAEKALRGVVNLSMTLYNVCVFVMS